MMVINPDSVTAVTEDNVNTGSASNAQHSASAPNGTQKAPSAAQSGSGKTTP